LHEAGTSYGEDRVRFLILGIIAATIGAASIAAQAAPRFKAVAFDYFVLFNANSILPKVEKEFPGRGLEFMQAWRARQFDYGFLRSITGRQEDFFKVTGDALDYTAAAMHLPLSADARSRLLDAYLTLDPWPDTAAALRKLKASGVRIITISNFSPAMLKSNAEHAGISDLFDELLSTEVNHSYKPEPRAYSLGTEHLGLAKDEILFVAFGGWDAYGAKSFGYPTYWVNRFNLPAERLGLEADATSNDLTGLLRFVLGN
jgi:2-haloacid dehalogenase